jgi:hypothetical protein
MFLRIQYLLLIKNPFTGILAVAKPCGIVVDVKELFNSESKTQVYAHLHQLLQKSTMAKTGKVLFT